MLSRLSRGLRTTTIRKWFCTSDPQKPQNPEATDKSKSDSAKSFIKKGFSNPTQNRPHVHKGEQHNQPKEGNKKETLFFNKNKPQNQNEQKGKRDQPRTSTDEQKVTSEKDPKAPKFFKFQEVESNSL